LLTVCAFAAGPYSTYSSDIVIVCALAERICAALLDGVCCFCVGMQSDLREIAAQASAPVRPQLEIRALQAIATGHIERPPLRVIVGERLLDERRKQLAGFSELASLDTRASRNDTSGRRALLVGSAYEFVRSSEIPDPSFERWLPND
jgi:hypothetical protein